MSDLKPIRVPLDIVAGEPPARGAAPSTGTVGGKPFLMVWFKCAGAYQKVFRQADAARYVARCPRCAKTMEFAVGPGGEARRLFEVSC